MILGQRYFLYDALYDLCLSGRVAYDLWRTRESVGHSKVILTDNHSETFDYGSYHDLLTNTYR